MNNLNKIRGCLIGGAAGDALGYTVEFMGEKEIFHRYGKQGITEYDLVQGEGIISDDTQMTLFTAMACILGKSEPDAGNSMEPYKKNLINAYKDWYLTQMSDFPAKKANKKDWLMEKKGLYARRAPGNTCLSAIRSGCDGTMEEPINSSKGCGGIMRVAPIALHFANKGYDITAVNLLGADAAALTHGHPLGFIPAGALVHIIYRIMEGMSVKEALENVIEELPGIYSEFSSYTKYLVDLMNNAVQLAQAEMDDLDAIHKLGEGWVAEETLAIAVYCAYKYHDDLDRCLIAAVNHKGDSDSTGAVAGNIIGAAIGYDAIPEKFKDKLEQKDTILKIADELSI